MIYNYRFSKKTEKKFQVNYKVYQAATTFVFCLLTLWCHTFDSCSFNAASYAELTRGSNIENHRLIPQLNNFVSDFQSNCQRRALIAKMQRVWQAVRVHPCSFECKWRGDILVALRWFL